MLIFEAKHELDERLKLKGEYDDVIHEYFEALEMASKALDAQQRLMDLLNDFYSEDEEKHKNDIYSRLLVMDLLDTIRWNWEGEE